MHITVYTCTNQRSEKINSYGTVNRIRPTYIVDEDFISYISVVCKLHVRLVLNCIVHCMLLCNFVFGRSVAKKFATLQFYTALYG